MDGTDPIDVEELNDVLDQATDVSALIGAKVTWYDDRQHLLMVLKTGEPAIKVRLHCTRCKKSTRVSYVTSGAPGWCYVKNLRGKFLADLRNQEYVCQKCSGAKPARSRSMTPGRAR